ncbi:hypothetical protein ASE00_05345 [Sphingomonas sp. Root710]|uniref:hypothetical protein n=1 Tax=Sphingomonas sp. Root710 TaxID=1736594 RepID=UPI0006F7EEBA|nr:hypothetical protein [Sphingomonas sp. Root710]KRB86159.1 hypothetical protein ASE00_05345 [Sphingomonas sp. Root710]
MVQKDTRRRSSLILGILLALLLGVAAGLFVLAVPVRMLETVTTFTRLSKLMVQAEPPISPSDRSLLAVLAGILTSGIGWVLVDWLLFGRAGLNRLIKPREDEYEDEDGDSFRPTDPLDLVSPVSLPVPEWTPSPAGDTRRPLSARTDIGDPPKPATPFGGGEPPLNPFGQILPGVGGSAPPLQPVVPPLGQLPLGGGWGSPDPDASGAAPVASWPPLDFITGAPAPQAGAPEQRAPAPTGWLPVPGARPDGGQPGFEASHPVNAPVPVEPQPAVIPPLPVPPALTPVSQNEAEPPQPPAFPAPRETFAAPPLEPLTPPPAAFEPPVAPAPFITPVLAAVEPAPAAPDPVVAPVAPPMPAPTHAPARESAPARGPSESGFDKARLEELLVRLERGLERRRAAAAAAATAVSAPVKPAAPVAAPVAAPAAHPVPAPAFRPEAPVEPPVAYAARMPDVPPVIPAYTPPPAEPAPVFTIAPSIAQPPAPEPAPVAVPTIALQTPETAARNDGMLDQPLHVTLDLLRSMVKR